MSVTAVDPEAVLLVLASGAWDEAWYLQEYPDVAAGQVEPLLHYLAQGWTELRSPGPLFDAHWYAQTYEDRVRGNHPLIHYLEHGIADGLMPRNSPMLVPLPDAPAAQGTPLLAEACLRQQQWCIAEEAIDRGDLGHAVSVLETMVHCWDRDWRARITLSWCLTELDQHDNARVVWSGPEPPRSLAHIPDGRLRLRAALAERALGFPNRLTWPVVEYQRKNALPARMHFRGLVEADLEDAWIGDDVEEPPQLSSNQVVLGLADDFRSVLVGRVDSKCVIRDAPFARLQAVRETRHFDDVPLDRFLDGAPVVQRQRFILNPGRVGSTLLVRMLREAGVEAISELEMHRCVALAVGCGEMDLSLARVLSSAATASVLDHPCDRAVVKLQAWACSHPSALMGDSDDAVVLWRAIHPWFVSWLRASRGDRSSMELVTVLENVVRAQISAAEEGRLRGVLWYEDISEGRLVEATMAFEDVLCGSPLRAFDGDSQVGTPLSRESLAGSTVPTGAWEDFAEAWGRSPAFSLARDLGLERLVDGVRAAPKSPPSGTVPVRGDQVVLPWNAHGSVEHYYHFLLGYLLPLARKLQGHDGVPLTLRDCGPMNGILREFERSWPLNILPPGRHHEEWVRSTASYVVGMDHWTRYRPGAILAATQAVREALGLESVTASKPRGQQILVIERGAPHAFYMQSEAEVKSSGVDRRSVPNVRELAASLDELGQTNVLQLEGMPLADQVRAFQAADIIVAQHGAALANLVWCRPGTGVVEIDPTNRLPYFSTLANAVGCLHRRVVQDDKHALVSATVVRAAVEEFQDVMMARADLHVRAALFRIRAQSGRTFMPLALGNRSSRRPPRRPGLCTTSTDPRPNPLTGPQSPMAASTALEMRSSGQWSVPIDRMYERLISTTSTVNQLNQVHIALDNSMTPAEAHQLAGHILHASTKSPRLIEAPDLWLKSVEWATTLQSRLDAGPALGSAAMTRCWSRRGLVLYQHSAYPSTRLLVCFAGGARRMMMPIPIFLQHASCLQADVLLVRGQRGFVYGNGVPGLSETFPGVLRWLKDFASQRPTAEIACVGCSAGALPAIVAGIQLEAASVLAAGTGRTDLAKLSGEPSVRDLSDLVVRVREAGRSLPNVHLVFGDGSSRDEATAKVISELLPGGSVTTVAGAGHTCLWPLAQRGEFTDLLDRTVGASWKEKRHQ